jgi:hypothetical protein
MDNPEKLATQIIEDEGKQSKNTTQSQRISQDGTQNVKTHNRTTQKTKNISNTDPTKTFLIFTVKFSFHYYLVTFYYRHRQFPVET